MMAGGALAGGVRGSKLCGASAPPSGPFDAFAFGVRAAGGAPGPSTPQRRGGKRGGAEAVSPTPANTPRGGKKAKKELEGEPRTLPEKLGLRPLRLALVGHNPSEHAWHYGHYYSNPSNRMWKLLSESGIAPPGIEAAEDDDRLVAAGVGFTDVGSGVPGTVSAEFSSGDVQAWRDGFHARLRAHSEAAGAAAGCTCGECGAPQIVAFTGKRQWMEVYNAGRKGRDKLKTVPTGLQEGRPLGWPLPERVEVWVLTSSSGASALTNEERLAPYKALGDRLKQVPWPLPLRCSGSTP